ncbi:MAG: ribosomal protein S18-alanine N-acetyltransferase [bacterium]
MIRRCNSNDIDAIVALEYECFNSPLTKDFITQEITVNPLSYYLCYEENGVVKGCIGLWLTDIGTILNVAVTKDSRGKGIGSKLIEETINVFNEHKIFQISLDVRVSNERAIALYKKYKFQEAIIRKAYYENQEDAIVMIRSVTV